MFWYPFYLAGDVITPTEHKIYCCIFPPRQEAVQAPHLISYERSCIRLKRAELKNMIAAAYNQLTLVYSNILDNDMPLKTSSLAYHLIGVLLSREA